jgi:hypothetical protein
LCIEAGLADDPWRATLAAVQEGMADAVPGILYRQWRAGEINDEQLPGA